jgi:hypothetical protein
MGISVIRFAGLLAMVSLGVWAEEPNAFRQSVDLAKTGKVATAEAVLEQKTFHPRGTFSWHLEMAGRLLQAAFLARESGSLAAGRQLAVRALGHLDKIEQGLPADSALVINALEMRAVIAERFTGTSTEADELRAEARRRNDREDQTTPSLGLEAEKKAAAPEVGP